MTREALQNRMLSNISAEYDKTEGSFFFDAIAPVAIELEKFYLEQDATLKSSFVDTAVGAYLERRCAEMGIIRKPATKATGQVEVTGAVGATIAKGSLVATELVTFTITQNVVIGSSGKEIVPVECTEYGTIGNVPANVVRYFPVTLEGISAVTNAAATVGGYDTETDESLRQRFYDKVNSPVTSGNAGHYKQWAKSVTGVGDAKVIPTWNGAGTVKIVICNANKQGADSELIADTAAYIETQRPIGATVTVESAMEKAVHVAAELLLENGRTLAQVKADFEAALINYFRTIAFTGVYVSYAKVGSLLYDVYGVADYSNLQLNGAFSNVTLTDIEIPTVGTVVFT